MASYLGFFDLVNKTWVGCQDGRLVWILGVHRLGSIWVLRTCMVDSRLFGLSKQCT
jgi:hypothetical protein